MARTRHRALSANYVPTHKFAGAPFGGEASGTACAPRKPCPPRSLGAKMCMRPAILHTASTPGQMAGIPTQACSQRPRSAVPCQASCSCGQCGAAFLSQGMKATEVCGRCDRLLVIGGHPSGYGPGLTAQEANWQNTLHADASSPRVFLPPKGRVPERPRPVRPEAELDQRRQLLTKALIELRETSPAYPELLGVTHSHCRVKAPETLRNVKVQPPVPQRAATRAAATATPRPLPPAAEGETGRMLSESLVRQRVRPGSAPTCCRVFLDLGTSGIAALGDRDGALTARRRPATAGVHLESQPMSARDRRWEDRHASFLADRNRLST